MHQLHLLSRRRKLLLPETPHSCSFTLIYYGLAPEIISTFLPVKSGFKHLSMSPALAFCVHSNVGFTLVTFFFELLGCMLT